MKIVALPLRITFGKFKEYSEDSDCCDFCEDFEEGEKCAYLHYSPLGICWQVCMKCYAPIDRKLKEAAKKEGK